MKRQLMHSMISEKSFDILTVPSISELCIDRRLFVGADDDLRVVETVSSRQNAYRSRHNPSPDKRPSDVTGNSDMTSKYSKVGNSPSMTEANNLAAGALVQAREFHKKYT